MGDHQYGRGTHAPHDAYVQYMEMIVDHPEYAGMPGARDQKSGRIQWQVSNSKKTSFFKHFDGRRKWWEQKADAINIPGAGKENERFAVTARLIHPTGTRPCLHCGEFRHVGYFYLNASSARALAKAIGEDIFSKWQPIDVVLDILKSRLSAEDLGELLGELFPEREAAFDRHGHTADAFMNTQHVRTSRLSPGYMCNCPYRLDGFHDYCGPGDCRKSKDKGRSDENLRSYAHDRRAFEWWAEGDWLVADALYNAAGPGRCCICSNDVDKVSPDHVGPLACGFRHLPFFQPMCSTCNSAKNRRLRYADVESLCRYESTTGQSPASWQVRSLWDSSRGGISSDDEANHLSNLLRVQQDFYLRVLHEILVQDRAGFLATLLSPRHALFDVKFESLDPALLTFGGFTKTPNTALRRWGLASRSVRIAFDSLRSYVDKDINRRKLQDTLLQELAVELNAIRSQASQTTDSDTRWRIAADQNRTAAEREAAILRLLQDEAEEPDDLLRDSLEALLKKSSDSLLGRD